MNIDQAKIFTDCGKEFELTNLQMVDTGSLNANKHYTYIIYKSPAQEFIRKKTFYNPAMNHTSINYEIIPESILQKSKAAL